MNANSSSAPGAACSVKCKAKLEGRYARTARLAAAGNVAALIEQFAQENFELFTFNTDKRKFLEIALQKIAKRGTKHVVETALKMMLSFDVALLARAHILARRRIKTADADHEAEFASLANGLIQQDLQRLAVLEDRLIALAKATASVQHLWSLASSPGGNPRRGRNRSPGCSRPAGVDGVGDIPG